MCMLSDGVLCVFPVEQRPRAVCSRVRQCGGCPRNGNQAATSPPMIHQTTRRPWSFSVTLTTRPMAARPGTPHAIDSAPQLPRSPPSFLASLSFSSWLLFPFLSVPRFVSVSRSVLALPPFNLLFCAFLDVTEIYLHCISCTHLFGFILNLRLFLLSQPHALFHAP